ncbi:MAG: hypothetical protein Q4D62_05415 [Planctomycetia bacterium]|nr:hypothetical protein [Planctomycetia bacterium]
MEKPERRLRFRVKWQSWINVLSTLLGAAYAKATMSKEDYDQYMKLLKGVQDVDMQRVIDDNKESESVKNIKTPWRKSTRKKRLWKMSRRDTLNCRNLQRKF